MRLAKAWVNTHFMSDYLEDSVVELLCMHVFTDVYSPYKAPKTAICGFFRFLSLLSSHSWFDTPLFVNTSVGDADVENIQREFSRRSEEYEKLDAKPSMYIVASYNLDYVWTKKNPPAIVSCRNHSISCFGRLFLTTPSHLTFFTYYLIQIVHRMVQLAKNTEIELNEYILSRVEEASSKLPSLFTSTDMDGYDLILTLKSEQEMRNNNTSSLPTGFNPFDLFYRDLKERFSRFGLFFKDVQNTTITFAINPNVWQPQPASITHTWCMKPLSSDKKNNSSGGNRSSNSFNKLQFNAEQFILEMEQLGKGIIHSIKANEQSSLVPYLEKNLSRTGTGTTTNIIMSSSLTTSLTEKQQPTSTSVHKRKFAKESRRTNGGEKSDDDDASSGTDVDVVSHQPKSENIKSTNNKKKPKLK